MKDKITITILCLACIASLSHVLANDNTSFTENLKTCAQYYGSQTIELNNIKLTTTKQIHGLKGEKCSYKETISTKDSTYSVNCMLSKEQIADMVKILEDFEKDDTAQKIDLNDFTQVENSTVVAAWSKYLQNPDICTIEVQ